MNNFATLFDINYLSRGLCLIDSLNKTLKNQYHLFVLALDEATSIYFKQNPCSTATILTLSELEAKYQALLAAKDSRSKVEYYFTLSPVLPLYILETYRDCKRITTLDADIYFFSSPLDIFKNYGEDDILITPHSFSSNLQYLVTYGYYNVSFQSFPNTKNALNVLKDWKDKCIEWCSDTLDPETGYFADQKYLDDWKINFPHIKDIDLPTCGRAPWNIGETHLKYHDGKFEVDGKPLIYYHFHHLRIYGRYIAHGLYLYGVDEPNLAVRKLYRVYLLNLLKNNKKTKSNSDLKAIRYNTTTNQHNLLVTIWEKELGAIAVSSSIIFFNIRLIKRAQKYIIRKLDGILN